ncbi:MAG: transglutaminase domain-containing protein [Gammaproteobacteria bacterium]|nr:transglutaminase domain-containing protein [Gammaproteobacteria bacterium]
MRELHAVPGWLGATLVFWGVATGHALLGVLGAVLIELAPQLRVRWEFSPRHFERLADLTSVIFVLTATYQFYDRGPYATYFLLSIFPLFLLPLVCLQLYSVSDLTPATALVRSLRRRRSLPIKLVDLRFGLGATALVAASAGGLPNAWYATGVALSLALLLFANRNDTWPLTIWSTLLVATLSLAYGLHRGLQHGQTLLGDFAQAAIGSLGWIPQNPDRAYTALGSLGRLKLSNQIRLRVEAPLNLPLPLRLTEARYQHFRNGIWSNEAHPLRALDQLTTKREWRLGDPPHAARQMQITDQRRGDLGALALPNGTTAVSGEEILELQVNDLGTVVAEARPGFLRYAVDFNLEERRDAPAPADLNVPPQYAALINDIAREAGALQRPPKVALLAIEAFFRQRFHYSLVQPDYYPGRMPLAEFLRKTRRGHCEYFASATTLILRAANIPARYAVGYVSAEYSGFEHLFLVRARHAHAWVEAYLDRRWQVVDTTPAQWYADEASAVPGWVWVTDGGNWLRLRFEQLQQVKFEPSPWLPGALPVLLAALIWRLRPLARRPATRAVSSPAQSHSALQPLLRRLAEQGLRPAPPDTVRAFLMQHWRTARSSELNRVIDLYYAARFRPEALTVTEHNALGAGVASLLEELP